MRVKKLVRVRAGCQCCWDEVWEECELGEEVTRVLRLATGSDVEMFAGKVVERLVEKGLVTVAEVNEWLDTGWELEGME